MPFFCVSVLFNAFLTHLKLEEEKKLIALSYYCLSDLGNLGFRICFENVKVIRTIQKESWFSYWGFGQAGGIFSTIGFSIELGLALHSCFGLR
jgi:hypothetical protein